MSFQTTLTISGNIQRLDLKTSQGLLMRSHSPTSSKFFSIQGAEDFKKLPRLYNLYKCPY